MKTLLYIDPLVPPELVHPHDYEGQLQRRNAFGKMQPHVFREKKAHAIDVFGIAHFFADRVHRVKLEHLTESQLRELILSDEWFQILLGGSDSSAYAPNASVQRLITVLAQVRYETRAPIFGICLGFEVMVKAWGGEISPMDGYLKGEVEISHVAGGSKLVGTSHGEFASALPENSNVLSFGPEDMPYEVDFGRDRGVQYHPEGLVAKITDNNS